MIPSPFVLIVLFLHKKYGTQSQSSGSLTLVNSKEFRKKSNVKHCEKQNSNKRSVFAILNKKRKRNKQKKTTLKQVHYINKYGEECKRTNFTRSTDRLA